MLYGVENDQYIIVNFSNSNHSHLLKKIAPFPIKSQTKIGPYTFLNIDKVQTVS